ncbi:MAG: MbnP family protein [Flavobacteriales bacterium]
MNTSKITVLLAALFVANTGCKKDEDPPVDDHDHGGGSATATVEMEFGFHYGTNDFDLANSYFDGASHAVQFTTIKFFVSGIHFVDDAQVEVAAFPDTYLLLDAATPEVAYTLGDVTGTHIHEAHFNLGLDSATNHADPTLAAAPLNDPTMHWAWNPAEGYKFLLVEGRVDDDGDGTVDINDPTFSYHCATDALLGEDEVEYHADITAGATISKHIEVQVDVLMMGIDALATPMGMGAEPVNVSLMQNLATAITVD